MSEGQDGEGMPVPTEGWQDMDNAPRDGTILVVRYHPWNDKRNATQVHMAQWIVNRWCAPFDLNQTVYADAWMTIDDLNKQIATAKDLARQGTVS